MMLLGKNYCVISLEVGSYVGLELTDTLDSEGRHFLPLCFRGADNCHYASNPNNNYKLAAS